MGANELMPGDYLQLIRKKVMVKIEAIMGSGITFKYIGGRGTAFYDQIGPIPLTPEILEKNGFEFGYTTSEEEFCSATGCGCPEEKGWCYDEGA